MKDCLKINWSGLDQGYYITPVVIGSSDKLPGTSKRVLCYLLTLATSNTDVHPSVKRIAEVTDPSERSAKYSISQLVELGLVGIAQRGNGRGLSNSYKVNASRLNEFFGCEILVDENTQVKEEQKATAPTHNKKGVPQYDKRKELPEDYFSQHFGKPSARLFKNKNYARSMWNDVEKIYGDSIPQYFIDDYNQLVPEPITR